MKKWERFWEWLKKQFEAERCPKHPGEKIEDFTGCPECWREMVRQDRKEERERKVRLIADGIKLAHKEMAEEAAKEKP